MITDRTGRSKVLLPINENCDKIQERNQTSVVRFHQAVVSTELFLSLGERLKGRTVPSISHKLPFYKSFLVVRRVKRLERYAQIFVKRLLKVEKVGRVRNYPYIDKDLRKKCLAQKKFSNFSLLRLYLFVCPTKPSWSLATVQPLTMAFKCKRLVLTCKTP